MTIFPLKLRREGLDPFLLFRTTRQLLSNATTCPLQHQNTRAGSKTSRHSFTHIQSKWCVLSTQILCANANTLQLDRLVGLAMLIVATTVFAYYTVWALLMVYTICIFLVTQLIVP